MPEHGSLAIGGERPGGALADGYFLDATVVTGLRQDDEMIQDEVFGPVITVQSFSDEDEALRLANGVQYGLASSVFTADHSRILLGGVDVTDHAPYARDVNTVFQDCALFRHMSVLQNVEYGLRVEGVDRRSRRTRAVETLQRFDFYGRDAVSLLVILPIALPGIVTGIALNNAFRTIFGRQLGFVTIVIAHATFCIVTVFNNVIARLRRTGVSLEQASADLGASGFTTFRLVTFPMIRSALIVFSVIPVRLAQRLSGDAESLGAGR